MRPFVQVEQKQRPVGCVSAYIRTISWEIRLVIYVRNSSKMEFVQISRKQKILFGTISWYKYYFCQTTKSVR